MELSITSAVNFETTWPAFEKGDLRYIIHLQHFFEDLIVSIERFCIAFYLYLIDLSFFFLSICI